MAMLPAAISTITPTVAAARSMPPLASSEGITTIR
jgi:hypothetical protein